MREISNPAQWVPQMVGVHGIYVFSKRAVPIPHNLFFCDYLILFFKYSHSLLAQTFYNLVDSNGFVHSVVMQDMGTFKFFT